MHPNVISIGNFHLPSYGLAMVTGFLITYFLAIWMAKRTGRPTEPLSGILSAIILSGIIGARFVYVVQNWTVEFADAPWKIFAVWSGGLVFYGGFIGSACALICCALFATKESPFALGDFVVTFLPLGHAFGRVGCFLYGCCFGKQCLASSPLAVTFPKGSPAWLHHVNQHLVTPAAPNSLPVYPTQLIEAAGNLLLFIPLLLLYPRLRHRPGMLTGIYLISYAILRCLIESFRDDPRGDTILTLSFSQFISVILAIVGILFITYAQFRAHRHAA